MAEDNSSTGNSTQHHDGFPKDDSNAAASKAKVAAAGWGVVAIFVLSWFTILYLAHYFYRRHQTRRRRATKSFFGRHVERDAYYELLEGDCEDEDMLRKALLRRAMTDVRRVRQLETDRSSLFTLMRAGAVSEELWSNFKTAEKEVELELFELQAEAETFKEGGGQSILHEAALLVRRQDELQALQTKRRKEEKAVQKEEKRVQKAKEREAREQEESSQKKVEKFLADVKFINSSSPKNKKTD